jgi:large subunit ribosomal protein L23
MALQTIIKRPLLTEKASKLRETGGADAAPAEADADKLRRKIMFQVARDANKHQIREAIEKLFNVKVTDVRTQLVRGKERRMGKFQGRRPNWKKAIVTLSAGQTIEFFEGV